MGEALFWGLVAGSSLLIGGVIASFRPVGQRALGLIMAFGSGVLISAVAYELVEEGFAASDGSGIWIGLLAGSVTFYAGDELLSRAGARDRKRSHGGHEDSSALAIVLGIVLDGIPESVVLGLTVLDGAVSAAVVAAVFLSNLPEAIAATAGLTASGWNRRRIFGLWSLVTVVSGLAALAGFALFDTASPGVLAFVLAFAAGAILTMLADTMMPEAFEHGGRFVGVVTTFGFGLAFAISSLE